MMEQNIIQFDASPEEMLDNNDLAIIVDSKGLQMASLNEDGTNKPITWEDIASVNNFKTRADMFNWLLSRQPRESWVLVNKYANNSKYIPIAKIEQLLKQIFKVYKIEILRENCWLNGFVVTIRLHYISPVDNQWYYHDGIGAIELQTKQGAQASDINAIMPNAWAKGVGIARSEAIKNAAKSFGDYFGANLNRKDTDVFRVNPLAYNRSNAEKLQKL